MKKDALSEALRKGLNRRAGWPVQAALWLVSCIVFWFFAVNARYAMIDEFSAYGAEQPTCFTAAVYTAIFALSFAVQVRMSRRMPLYAQVLAALVTGAVLLAKISLLDYVSDDYSIFLSDWIFDYSQMGFKQALGTYIGSDYTPPYLYILALISRVNGYPWQYLVKAVSIAFDILLAYAVAMLAGLRLRGDGARLAVFHIASILPTVVFNGAYWAQCDVIYTSLCLMALYFALTQRSARCMIFLGMALSFKLQTVFFFPALLPLWLRRDIKLRHLPLIPAAYMAMMIPALWAGKSLHHVLTVYLVQAGGYNFMTVNAPSIWQFLPELDKSMLFNMFGGLAMAMGMAFLFGACALVCLRRENLSRQSALLFALLILGGVPLFLPKMHERYTFGADVLALAVCFICMPAWPNPAANGFTASAAPASVAGGSRPGIPAGPTGPVISAAPVAPVALPLLYGLASYICYTGGLPGDAVMELKWASVFQMLAVALTAMLLWRSLRGGCADEAAQTPAEVKA